MTWWDDMRAAARENAADEDVFRTFHDVPWQGLSVAILARVPYRFEGGERTPIRPWFVCLRRGHAACGDAAALVAAVAGMRGEIDRCTLLFEDIEDDPSYAHVRTEIDGVIVDPYPEQSYADGRPRLRLPARSLLDRTLRKASRF